MDSQTVIVILIIVVVGFFSIRRTLRVINGKEKGCNCGCNNCSCHTKTKTCQTKETNNQEK